jgi:uncharacterized membrane protein
MDSWFILSLAATFSFTGMTLLFRMVTEKGIPALLGLSGIVLVSTPLIVGYTFLTQKSFNLPTNIMIILVIAGVFSFLGNIFLFRALGTAPNPGYPGAVEALKIILITFISFFLFNLKPNPIGIVGSILVVVGVILLSVVS